MAHKEKVITKAELVKEVARLNHNNSQANISHLLDQIINSIAFQVTQGNKVELARFGTFSVAHRLARKGRNPRNGEPIDIPAKDVPIFKAGKNFREKVKYPDKFEEKTLHYLSK